MLNRATWVMQGAADTKEYRQFVQHEGKDISAWHDIPLQNEDGTFNFVCEIPKETSAKMEVATVSALHALSFLLSSALTQNACDLSQCLVHSMLMAL